MALYRKEKINPFSSFLPLLIQLPILIALFKVFWKGFGPEELTTWLYNFIPHPGQIKTSFLGILNLSEPSVILAILAGISQFFQTKMLVPASTKVSAGLPASTKVSAGKPHQSKKGKPDFFQMMQKQMLYFFPILTVFILLTLPSAIGLYWITTIVFSIAQQYFSLKRPSKNAYPK